LATLARRGRSSAARHQAGVVLVGARGLMGLISLLNTLNEWVC